VRYIVDKNGVEHRVATLTENYGQGHRLYFWVIQNDAELQSLQNGLKSSSGKAADLSVSLASGRIGFKGGGWIYYTSTTIQIFIPHNDAVTWETGFGFVALVCALVAIIPAGQWAGGVCAFMAGLSALVINHYDSMGAPGFYINATKKPFRVWLSP
jgi:hypothetical protein